MGARFTTFHPEIEAMDPSDQEARRHYREAQPVLFWAFHMAFQQWQWYGLWPSLRNQLRTHNNKRSCGAVTQPDESSVIWGHLALLCRASAFPY